MKLATNWIMGDIAAYMKNEKVSINEIKLTPQELAELIASIKGGTISGKIGKEVKACFSVNQCIQHNILLSHFIAAIYFFCFSFIFHFLQVEASWLVT